MSDFGLRVLIVEDQYLIAKQVEMIVSGAGHQVVGIAGTLNEACRLAMASEPDIAFVDLSLADGTTGLVVGDFIRTSCRTLVIYMTANLRRIPEDFAGAVGVVEKPFTKTDLLTAMAFLTSFVKSGLMPDKVPASLKLAPQAPAAMS